MTKKVEQNPNFCTFEMYTILSQRRHESFSSAGEAPLGVYILFFAARS